VAGYDVVAQAQQVRRLIALTGQYAAVDESLTGAENLLLIGRLLGVPRGAARRRGAELLDQFGLADAGGRAAGRPRPTRAACAAAWTWPPAWSAGPGCCTWTEPTTGLDPRARNDLWGVIRELTAGGVTCC
jgi:oleandomycin transport system ATP-binding protein